MHALPAAIFPQAGVGLVVETPGMFAQCLEAQKLGLGPRLDEAVVEKELRGRQHYRTVDVVLHLLECLVAAADRTHAAVTGQRIDDLLVR